MVGRMAESRRPRRDAYRTAQFRDIARGIVAKDRNDRRDGFSVDTAGAIARALERAFREGFIAAHEADETFASTVPSGSGHNGPIDWLLIPPRPRNAFWTCCLFILGEDGQVESSGCLQPITTVRGTPGWRLVVGGSRNLSDEFGDRTIQPLLRLGLLQLLHTSPDLLGISPLGYETWMAFRARGGRYPEDSLKPLPDSC